MLSSDDGLPDTPNCRTCLHPMGVAGEVDRPYWACPDCGTTALSH